MRILSPIAIFLLLGCIQAGEKPTLEAKITGFDSLGREVSIYPDRDVIELTAINIPTTFGRYRYVFYTRDGAKEIAGGEYKPSEFSFPNLVIENTGKSDYSGPLIIETDFLSGFNSMLVANYYGTYTSQFGVEYAMNYTVYYCDRIIPPFFYVPAPGEPSLPLQSLTFEEFRRNSWCYMDCFYSQNGSVDVSIPAGQSVYGKIKLLSADLKEEIDSRRIIGKYHILDDSCNISFGTVSEGQLSVYYEPERGIRDKVVGLIFTII